MSGGAVAMSSDSSDAGMFGKYYASKIGALREVSSEYSNPEAIKEPTAQFRF
jgi:hypothetical protein